MANIDIVITAKDYATKTLAGIQKQTEGLAEKMQGVFKTVIGLSATATVGIVGYGVNSAKALEVTRTAFVNLYGSAEQAGKTISNLVDFANKTPFEMPEIADMALKLKNVAGVTDEKLIPTLTKLGDIASSQGKSLTQMTEAFLDATTGEFERLKEFGIKASSAGDQVTFSFRGQTETVAKTAEGIGAYLEKVGQMEGIQGGMIAQSKTLDGLFSTFKDTIGGLTRNLVGMSDTGEIIKGSLLDKMKVGLEQATIWINNNKDQIKAFGVKVTEVINKIMPLIGEFIENATSLYNTISNWAKTHPILAKLALGITGVATALLLLNANPIGALITAFVLLVTKWDWVKLNIGGGLYFMMKDFKEKFDNIIKYFTNFGENLKSGFLIIINNAKQWGLNLIKMFIDGIKQKAVDMKNAVAGVANTIADYLGFHSPTKMGPASDSDKWMPNLINMLAKGLEDGKSVIEEKSLKIATLLGIAFGKNIGIEGVKNVLSNIQGVFQTTFSSISSNVDASKSKITSLKDEINGLKNKFAELGQQRLGIESEAKVTLANKALELEKQIVDLKVNGGSQQDINSKEEELALSKRYITEQDLINARIEMGKSETQKIIDDYQKKVTNIENERTLVQTQLQNKLQDLKTEEDAYKALMDSKIGFENQYYNLFKENINGVKVGIQDAINLMTRLNAMSSYNVGDLKTTSTSNNLFTPNKTENQKTLQSATNININMGGVSVTNSADENRLVDKIKKALINDAKLYNLGIN